MGWKKFTDQRPKDGEEVIVWFNPGELDLMTYREGPGGYWSCESDGEIFWPDLWCRIVPPGVFVVVTPHC